MRKKLRDSAGFSLVETLCAVAVLVLLSLMLNSGLSAAMQTYYDITAESETQLLLNSLTNAIARELRYAHDVTEGDDPTYNKDRQIKLQNGQVYAGGRELLPKEKETTQVGGAYKNGEYVASRVDESTPLVRYKDGCFTIRLKVTNESNGISAETPPEGVVIRCLNPPKKGGGTTP